ncbi:zinc metalloprotease HtpX [Actinomyces wuliandei]|uniref:zinc metalloprotease HtpX n=1 Tax=Actinomyces wuliandei TaxID=2057743 RepID=UPI000FDB8F9D|nr:zinc metalloprotease HtpX [Actinomyces wuliandei]
MNGTNHYNGLKTAVLLGGMWGLLILIGYVLAQGTGSSVWLFVMPLIGVAQTAYAYWNSDKIAVRSMGAIEVSEAQYPQMYAIVRELSTSAGQPMPRLYVAPTVSPNAFATGRDPQHAAVCCTQGILQLLNDRELRGVLGHELSHVYNRDILTSSVAAGIAGVISSISTMALWFGGGRDRRDGGNVIVVLLLALLAPLAAALTQFAISRTREFDADHDGAVLTHDPLALASALRKLETGVNAAPLAQDPRVEPVSSMMIANPFGSRVRNLFATHPPMDQRIARLEKMAGY